ncbi:MAG: AMP-binding protein [archaeon]|nr:AMP-binding protein [archaeon]
MVKAMHKNIVKEEWYEQPSNLVEAWEDSIKKFGSRDFIGTKNKTTGEYEFVTYNYVAERATNLRGGFAQIGVNEGDCVGLIIDNSVEWPIVAQATFARGGALVPMYQKELPKVWKYIVKDSGVKALLVANDEIYEQVKDWVSEIDTLENIYSIRGTGENSMAALEKKGKENPVDSIKPGPMDICVLIYTSGTTGDPKGVLLSHGNFTTNVAASHQLFPDADENTVSFAILPWAHSFGITAEAFLGTHIGGSCGLMDSIDTILEDLPKVAPTILVAVPRVFNKVYAGVHNLMREEGGIKEKMFYMAKAEAKKKRETGKAGLKWKILDKLVFGKLRAKLGGRMTWAVTGSAAMNPEIAQFFVDIGVPTFDCYGLTETSPALTMNSPDAVKLGSVGRAIPKVTVVIDKSRVGEDSKDGEIICYGPNVMHGYHNKPEKTAEVMIDDPELGTGVRTGDRGWLDEEGYLHITGRFKEEYKLENGKYVHPASLEEDIKLVDYVANCMIYGDGKRYNVCMVVPDFEAVDKYCERSGIDKAEPNEIIKNEKITSFINSEISNRLKGDYGGYEIPKKFLYLTEDFTVDNGMATQTMKLKRRNVLQTYGDKIEALYKE